MQPPSSTPYQIMENRPGFSPRYSSAGGLTTGVIQLVCGLAVVVLGIVSHALALTWSIVSTGIWSGLLFFGLAGILGILSAKKSSCLVVGYMVMSILASIVAFFAGCTYLYMITAVRAACPLLSTFEQDFDSSDESINIPSGIINCTNPTADVAVNACLVAIFFIEFIVAIVGSGFGCGGVCCGTSSSSTTHTTMHVVTSQPLGAWPGQQQGYTTSPQGYPQGYTAAPPNSNAPQAYPQGYTAAPPPSSNAQKI